MKTSKKLQNKIKFYAQYIPITKNALFLVVVLAVCYFALQSALLDEEEFTSSYMPFLKLMVQTTFLFFMALMIMSLLTVLASWLYHLYIKNKKNINTEFDFQTDWKDSLIMKTKLPKAIRPFLGTIKNRLVYDDLQMTELFVLGHNFKEGRSMLRTGIGSQNKIALPDIKEYQVKGNFLFFQDFFQLFSFPIFESQSTKFYQPPQSIKRSLKEAKPYQVIKEDIRIDEPRKIPGDYLHYKGFEQGDDIRRIVWKVYAKSREFIVRIPEMNEPYAAHLRIVASFHNDLSGKNLHPGFTNEMLNFYKENIWSIYNSLTKDKSQVTFIADQEIIIGEEKSQDAVQKMISHCNWQKEIGLPEIIKQDKIKILCISSFNDPSEIEDFLNNNQETTIYFTKLSDCFKHQYGISLLSRIFLKEADDPEKKLKSRWLFSPWRIPILKREKAIEKILNKYSQI